MSSVGEECPVDDVGETAFERAERLGGGVSVGSSAL
jgi:hypothetical protein